EAPASRNAPAAIIRARRNLSIPTRSASHSAVHIPTRSASERARHPANLDNCTPHSRMVKPACGGERRFSKSGKKYQEENHEGENHEISSRGVLPHRIEHRIVGALLIRAE